MVDIHFIVNPIAGSGKQNITEAFLLDYFEANKFNITLKPSAYKGHAIELTKDSIHQKAHIIVACGGDGTINEVASTLVGTDIPLGIIPIGSGNGLASNLHIPKNIKKALNIIKNNNQTKIDVGCINERYFFSNTGLCFTANVIENYEALQTRTLWCYTKATLKSFWEYSNKTGNVLYLDGEKELTDPLLFFISNSNMMGYNFSLTPKASLKDGLLDIVVVPKINRFKMVLLGFCMVIKKPEWIKEVKLYQSNKLAVSTEQDKFFQSQIDGELTQIKEQTLFVSLKEKALSVIVC